MNELFGALLIVSGVGIAVYLFHKKSIDVWGFLAMGAVVVVAGAVVANFRAPDIRL